MNQPISIAILAAGLGTRMKSRRAKVLHEAGGLPLVEHVVLSALELAPPEHITVVVGHQAAEVEARLQHRGVRFARQQQQLGTAHALLCAREQLGQQGLVLTLYGDTPLLSSQTLRRLVQHHQQSGAAATVITAVLEDPTGYGRIITDESGFIEAIVEHKVAGEAQRAIREINSGIYCFDAAALWEHLPRIQANPVSKEYYLTDIVELFRAAGLRVSRWLHPDPSELLGINTRIELAQVDQIFRRRKAEELMLAGVTIRHPDTVSIDREVRVGMDTIIESSVAIHGRSSIGENCHIGAGAILSDVEIGDGVTVGPYTVIAQSQIGARASIGPFARLRVNNVLGPGVHIGNFVELKNARLGEGVKAGHLAYLGDADVGARVNVGAGTITCNYDGERKHETAVGEGAFLGSNSTLVAPLRIGAGSYIGAGSVITDDVPPDALALGRARQVIKEGWARRRRQSRAISSEDNRSEAQTTAADQHLASHIIRPGGTEK